MNEALPYLAFSMGIMSSFHCVGMCGPISLALPIHQGTPFQKISGLVLYNSGRALTYAILGLILGSLGTAFLWFGIFKYLSIGMGVLLFVYAIQSSYLDKKLHTPLFWQRIIESLKKQMRLRLTSNQKASWFILGSLNGLVPCGMVYMALMTSLATSNNVNGGLFMLIFGLGTFPAMFAVGYFKEMFNPKVRTWIKKASPILIATAGIWLVVRGITAEYSPTHSHTSNSVTICR